MLRYVGLIWESSRAAGAAEARRLLNGLRHGKVRWESALRRDGLEICCAIVPEAVRPTGGAHIHSLHEGSGVVLGTLFPRLPDGNESFPRPDLHEGVSTRIVQSKGKYLIEAYWGRYVAFLFDHTRRSTCVVRDPTGTLPCFMTQSRGITVVFSRLEDCIAAGLGPFCPNWEYLAARSRVTWRLEARETALCDISNLIAGECVEFHAATSARHVHWHPVQIANSDPLEDPIQARDALYRTAKRCVSAWACQYPRALLLLSGGFDSSVLLSLVRAAPTPPELQCLNRYSDGADDDERQFARLAAAQTGSPLIELRRDPQVDFRRLLHVRPSPLTPALIQALEFGDTETELSLGFGASAIFGGQFGDQLFYQSPLGLIAADHVYRHSLSRTAFRLALDTALTEHSSVWKHLSWTVRYGLLRRPHRRSDDGIGRALICNEFRNDRSLRRRFMHPWLLALSDVGPGKGDQIAAIADPMEYYDPFHAGGGPERVFPFDSQPLMETCLRIPTYVLAMGGKSRGLARQAFAAAIPRAIARRHSKGEMEEHYRSMLRHNLPFIRELLLDGKLVQRGIVDRAATEEALSGRTSAVRVTTLEIFDLVSIEAWLTVMAGAGPASAA